MASDFFSGLLGEHLLLALVMALMVLEALRADPRYARLVFGAVLLAAGAAMGLQLADGYASAVVPGELVVDPFALIGKLLLAGFAFALLFGYPERAGAYKFWILVASSLLGAMVMLGSTGFATLFLGIEMLSLPAFALMVQGRGASAATEGAFKYLLLSSVATALLLLGVALAYGVNGTLSIQALAQGLSGGAAQGKAAALLVLCGLFLKAAVFPFHGWAPDAYASARLPVTALLASLVKGAVVLTLVRVFAGTSLDSATTAAIAVLGIASIVYGNLAALGQLRLRRLLAYSSVAHAGYMIFALVDATGSRASDLLWYVAFYGGGTLLACAAFAAISPDDDRLESLDGQFSRHPVAALLLGLAVLSLAGLPPFPGFFAKLFVFKSVIASGYLVPAILAFVGSFLGLAYYLGIVMRLFRTDQPAHTAGRAQA